MRSAQQDPYQFKPHERPLMPGSPATPEHPLPRRYAYFAIGAILGISGGLSNGMLLANTQQLQGAFGLSSVESGWLTAAYSMTNVCTGMVLVRFRQRFGVGLFARIFLPSFAIVSFLQLFLNSYRLELLVRGVAGVVASGLTSFCLLYMIQALPARWRLRAMALGIGMSQLALPLARAISPGLLANGDIHNLFAFELGLSLLGVGSAALLPLPPAETIPAFEPLDALTIALLAPGMALLCAVLSQGRTVWWTTDWLGYALAASVILIAAAFMVEHNRANPLLNVRWMASSKIVQIALLAITMRVLLSEQSFGTTGLLQMLGVGTDQLARLYMVVTLATLAGLTVGVVTLDVKDLLRPVLISCGLIALGAWMDSNSSDLTRPQQFYLSQSLIAFAAIQFIGPVMMMGNLRATVRGPSHVISFSATFSISQTVGGLAGSAMLGTLQVWRERLHSSQLVQDILLTDPQVAARVDALSSTYGRVLGDPTLRRAEGLTLLSQQVSRQANVLAYNDVFLVIAGLAAFAFVAVGVRWLYYRRHGIDPLAEDMAAMARMREEKTRG